jgi:hypothetical protein
VFAGSQLSHWDFPRNTASAAVMTEFGRANGLAVADVLEGSGLSATDLHDHGRTIVGREELAIATNLVDLLGAEAGAADLGIRVGTGYHVGSFGIFGFACLTSSTLGDTVRFAASAGQGEHHLSRPRRGSPSGARRGVVGNRRAVGRRRRIADRVRGGDEFHRRIQTMDGHNAGALSAFRGSTRAAGCLTRNGPLAGIGSPPTGPGWSMSISAGHEPRSWRTTRK